MDIIKVSPAELEGFASKLQSSSAELDNILDGLRSKLDGMQWSGGDKESYEAQRREWDSAARDLNHLLNQIGRSVGLAKQDYVNTEGVNARMFA
ncbi:MAG TPA: WXG100 family type VII secretion target [Stackebrandtia sp.]|jgi:WXG100 family type VII secretion target|uniref:WXG100 family type VII secretion target n=1 Tax=Stackebrandtia sp. TaxID=2023065 RepID=UPI002D2D2F95|nr:WXG100 family type VII secretion target [Stackebrandtia sp.]HZE39128.1 WXG100 family type VII secretion target [Stackebrandtia sp.]